MFSSAPNYTKLKTNLRLSINRLKLLEKKKTELTQKSRKEIADYLETGKLERAKIRVEHIIREDYLVEAMEVVEMYCDLLLARFGLVTQMKELDEGIAEAVSSLIWVAPRLQADVPELKVVADLLSAKYGKIYSDNCRSEVEKSISAKLKHKLAIQSPAKLLVEKYLIEIAKSYNVEYEPDSQVMQSANTDILIDLTDKNNFGGTVPPMGFIGFPQAPTLPEFPSTKPFNYPSLSDHSMGGFVNPDGSSASAPPPSMPYGAPFSYNIPPADCSDKENLSNFDTDIKPVPQPGSNDMMHFPGLPNLPSVPKADAPSSNDIDFDDLTRRFEELKKKK